MKEITVSRNTVKRFLLHSQHLLGNENSLDILDGSEAALELMRWLECVQLDPVSVVERNQHLVFAARLSGYRPEHLNSLLAEGKVFEYWANAACVIPMEDYPILKPVRNRLNEQVQPALKKLDFVAEAVLERLKSDGPLPSRAFKSENFVHGYWDNTAPKTKDTSHALNLLLDAGIIRVVNRDGNERYFDLAEKTVPADILQRTKAIDLSLARKALIEKYMRAYRVFDFRDARFGWQKLSAQERRAEIEQRIKSGTVAPLIMENVKTPYFILTEDIEKLRNIESWVQLPECHIRFLPPLDNLLWRRERLVDLFDFDYKWEIYIPQHKRRYGAYALPILYGDRLIGRINPRLDRKEGRMFIQLLQLEPDVQITDQLRTHIQQALEGFTAFHGAKEYRIERSEPEWLPI